MKAVEEKKLNLDQTIDKYFPKIENASKITVANLLYHRSGIHSFTNDKEYLTWNTQPKNEKEMIEIIVKGGSDFEPDSKSEYSNSNFVLLTFIVEQAFKKPYSELVTEYITKPAGLKNTGLGSKIDTKNNECKSYKFTDKWNVEPETDISIPLGAGGIVSTPADLQNSAMLCLMENWFQKKVLNKCKPLTDNMEWVYSKYHFLIKTDLVTPVVSMDLHRFLVILMMIIFRML